VHGNSKSERLNGIIERAVMRALREVGWDRPDHLPVLKELARTIVITVQYELTSSPYAMREIQDVMDWKKPKEA
jgi:hypothetical protein